MSRRGSGASRRPVSAPVRRRLQKERGVHLHDELRPPGAATVRGWFFGCPKGTASRTTTWLGASGTSVITWASARTSFSWRHVVRVMPPPRAFFSTAARDHRRAGGARPGGRPAPRRCLAKAAFSGISRLGGGTTAVVVGEGDGGATFSPSCCPRDVMVRVTGTVVTATSHARVLAPISPQQSRKRRPATLGGGGRPARAKVRARRGCWPTVRGRARGAAACSAASRSPTRCAATGGTGPPRCRGSRPPRDRAASGPSRPRRRR